MPLDEPRRSPVATTNDVPLLRTVTLGEGQRVTLSEASGVAFAEAARVATPRRSLPAPDWRWFVAGAVAGFVLGWRRAAPDDAGHREVGGDVAEGAEQVGQGLDREQQG